MDSLAPRYLRDQRGFGFAQLMVIMPIVLIIMGSAASYFYDKLLTNIQVRARSNFEIHHQNMMTDLENPMVWDEILRVNEAFHCMEDETCSTVAKRDFIVVGVDGKYLSGPTTPGYRMDGTPCKPPKAGEEDQVCPIRWRFQWRPMCSRADQCPSDSEIEFFGELVEDALFESNLNLDRYKIVLYRRLF